MATGNGIDVNGGPSAHVSRRAAPPVPRRERDRRILPAMPRGVAGNDAWAVDAGRSALWRPREEPARDCLPRSVDEAPVRGRYEGLGVACRWLGEQEASIRHLQRAYRLHRLAGDVRGRRAGGAPARSGECYFHEDVAAAWGWVERADACWRDGTRRGAGWLTLVRGPPSR
jgi:hypothetical protein